MSARSTVGQRVEAALGKERTDQLRKTERRYRKALAGAIAPTPTKAEQAAKSAAEKQAAEKQAAAPPPAPAKKLTRAEAIAKRNGWVPSDPFVDFPAPTMTRHDLLAGLHEHLRPRTYLEVGVNSGGSLSLSRAKTIGVDPAFKVVEPILCDLDLVKAKSDDFFARPDGLDHFGGVPIDLAFIDGMHLSEYALRDFINIEKHLAASGVAVFDDVLPRNPLEAARDRKTDAWAGDIYKAVEILARRRPDLVVLLVNTAPTGTAVIVGADAASTLLSDAYESEVPYLEAVDPQTPPEGYMHRTAAVQPADLLASEAWALLVQGRESGDAGLVEKAKDVLRATPTIG